MAFKTPSNRKIHPQNGKVVKTAIDTIKTTTAISQEKYWNAFRVDGHTCSVYNMLRQGKICSCSVSIKTNPMKPILDEDGNAPASFINTMLSGGLISGISNYGEENVPAIQGGVKITQLDTVGTVSSQTHINTDLSTPNEDYIEEDYSDDFLDSALGMNSTSKCTVCYGSGYVGGFNLCFGNRFVLDSTHINTELYGFNIHQENSPYTFESMGGDTTYVKFKVTLPFSVAKVSSFVLRNNIDDLSATIEASFNDSDYTPVSIYNLKDFCVGTPVYIRVSDIECFTHLELDFLVSDENTYLDYPMLNQTGDIAQLEAIGDVTIYVSPTVPLISEKDIIVDNTWGKVWRVTTVNNHKDRNVNIHGWDITAKLVQSFEIYSYLPSNKTLQRQLNTNLNRW